MTTEEMAVYIGERLLLGKLVDYAECACFDWTDGGHKRSESLDIFTAWLSSPDGIYTVKQSMFDLGYTYKSFFRGTRDGKQLWDVCFCHWMYERAERVLESSGDTEAEAVIGSSYNALKLNYK